MKKNSKRNKGTNAKILAKIRNSPFEKVKLCVTNIDGVLRGKYTHKDKFL